MSLSGYVRPLANWQTMPQPLDQGGLGVVGLEVINTCLLSKCSLKIRKPRRALANQKSVNTKHALRTLVCDTHMYLSGYVCLFIGFALSLNILAKSLKCTS